MAHPSAPGRHIWIGLGLLTILWSAALIVTTPAVSATRDFGDGLRQLTAARAFLAGGDPYIPGYLYAPPSLILASPFTLLPDQAALWLWALIETALVAWCVSVETRGWPRADRVFAGVATLAFAPVAADILLGNTTVLLCVTAWILVRGGNGVAFGVVLAAFPKPLLFPILLWALVHRRRGAVQAVVTAVAVTVAALPLGHTEAFLGALGTAQQGFAGDGGLASISAPVWAIGAGIGVVGYLWALWRRDALESLVWACAVALVAAPYTGLYGAVPLLIPALALARRYPWRVAILGHAALVLQLAIPFAAALIAAGAAAAASVRRPLSRVAR